MDTVVSKYGQPSKLFPGITVLKITPPPGNVLLMKKVCTNGFFKDILLEDDVRCSCAIYNPQGDFHIHRIPLNHEFFILRIDDILPPGSSLPVPERRHKALLLSSLEEFTFFASKGSCVKTLEIVMPQRWFLSKLPPGCSYSLLKKYMAAKTWKQQIDCANPLFRKLIPGVLHEAHKESSDVGNIQKRVNALLEMFFSELSSRLHTLRESEKVKISKDEINRLINVRKYLDVDLSTPSFTSLTKIAFMSSTSLKTKFKKMYGATVFEYFQSMRMQRARILLLTHKYSVKQIGRQLGYSNPSNFTIAFKKEFNRLPHELIK